MKKYVIGMVYYFICFIRIIIFTSIPDFPHWVYVVWILVPCALTFITLWIEAYKDDK